MKIFLIISLVVLLLIPVILGIYLIVFNMFYRKYFSIKGSFLKGENKKFLKNISGTDEDIFKDFKPITCENSIKLKGVYKNNGSDKLAILLHSFGGDYRQTAPLSKTFLQEGFDVLAVDSRGHGKSEGVCDFSHEEGEDLQEWICKMLSINPNYNIVLYGIGLGGSSILSALNNLPQKVKLIFCESAFDSMQKELSFIMSKSKIKPPKKMFYHFLKQTKNLSIFQDRILDNVKKSRIPLAIIHAERDEIVPLEMGYSLNENNPSLSSNFLILKNCNHAEGGQRGELKLFILKTLQKYGV